MKYLKQFGTIMIIAFLGEVLKAILPLPIPGSIYGILLLFFALEFKVIKLSDVQETGKYLIEIMAVMFVPAAASMMKYWDQLQPFFFKFVFICVITTFIVMIVTGRITQWLIRIQKKSKNESKEAE